MDELRAGDPDQVGLNHDLYRGTNDAPFWVMEQQPGDVNWPPTCPQPGEGAMRLWAHHAVAHGAASVLYFRWRRCRQGQEQYHAGLRKQDGSPDRGYTDAVRAAAELAAIVAEHRGDPGAVGLEGGQHIVVHDVDRRHRQFIGIEPSPGVTEEAVDHALEVDLADALERAH